MSSPASPYFAVDPVGPAQTDSFLKQWHRARKLAAGARLYAMVDAAFDEQGVAEHLQRQQGDAISLYAGTDLEEHAEVSPWLLELSSDDPDALACEVKELADLRGTRPMLSFIATARSLPALQHHFRPFLRAVVDDDLLLLLRFADTRIVEVLGDVFTPQQSNAFLPGDIGIWLPRRRHGDSASSPIDPARPHVSLVGPVTFDAKQFASLLEAGEPDLVIHNLTRSNAQRFNGVQPSKVYDFIAGQLQRARAHGLQDMPNLETYCLTAWTTNPQFDEQPDFTYAITQASRTPGRLSALLNAVPDAAWQQASQLRSPSPEATP
ncbi:hypothetical protein CKY39_00820 [Variovorax boronicumulans]|uniref:DUF4123 domain-containing protein n=1 Tax=Variovorax boronicumulans TaxID=436515 RepID=A0A250DC62_9BURK|nr:DUF4123 domain-containing protein [Variovorax boronicumulans]ATA51930.1 hypothetical protein CKY39_00820 [Variovorax boronicumulans]